MGKEKECESKKKRLSVYILLVTHKISCQVSPMSLPICFNYNLRMETQQQCQLRIDCMGGKEWGPKNR